MIRAVMLAGGKAIHTDPSSYPNDLPRSSSGVFPPHSLPSAVMKSEIAEFVERGASHITPSNMQKLLHQMPLLKAEFTQIDEPTLPHLVDQLEFLADAVEDAAEGSYTLLPYYALAAASFALVYAHEANDIIPDSVAGFGHLDDSAVVRYVLMRYDADFQIYAASRKLNWKKITTAA